TQGKHVVQVANWQEMDRPDAVRLVRALPPAAGGADGQLAVIRDRSRQRLAQPRAVVERDIASRFGHQQPAVTVAQPSTMTAQTTSSPPTTPARQTTRRRELVMEDAW